MFFGGYGMIQRLRGRVTFSESCGCAEESLLRECFSFETGSFAGFEQCLSGKVWTGGLRTGWMRPWVFVWNNSFAVSPYFSLPPHPC